MIAHLRNLDASARSVTELLGEAKSHQAAANRDAAAGAAATTQVAEPGRVAGGMDLSRIERAVREILLAVGENPDRAGLAQTPSRVARAYAELLSGLQQSPREHLDCVFDEDTEGPVVLRDIDFVSLCEHHLLPFSGRAHVAYLPGDGKVVGLSKLARTVEVYARRPQVQERLTGQIADALERHLQPLGVAVVVESEHMCMKMRGVCKPHGQMLTTATRGCYADDPAARQELMQLIQSPRR